jgi:hypothetical protein
VAQPKIARGRPPCLEAMCGPTLRTGRRNPARPQHVNLLGYTLMKDHPRVVVDLLGQAEPPSAARPPQGGAWPDFFARDRYRLKRAQ